MTAHIVTMGGGGFSMASNGAPTNLDRFLLELSGTTSPMVCFVPTASADDPTYINRFFTAYGTLGVRTMILTLWQGAADSVKRLADADIVLVGGGSTVNLMALWDAHGVSAALRDLRQNKDGVVLAGVSAGASCFYEGCVTDSFGEARAWRGGLGMLPGSFCPHFDGEVERAPAYTQAVADGELPGGFGADDGAGIHYIDGRIENFVTEQEGKRVLRIMPSNEPSSSGVLTEPMAVDLL